MIKFIAYCILFTSAGGAVQQVPAELSSVEAACEVTQAQATGQTVDLTATVTYWDPVWNFMFVEDKGEGIFVSGRSDAAVTIGQRVRIEGKLAKADLNPIVDPTKISVIDGTAESEPVPVDLATLQFGQHDADFVVTECEVVQTQVDPGHTLLFARAGGSDGSVVRIKVRHTDGDLPNAHLLAGSRIRVRGSLGVYFASKTDQISATDRRVGGFYLFCNSSSQVEVLGELPESSPETIRDLVRLKQENIGDGPFVAYGQISLILYRPTHALLVVSDDSAAQRFRVQFPVGLQPGMLLKLRGKKSVLPDGELRFDVNHMEQINLGVLPPAPEMTLKESIDEYTTDKRVCIEGTPLRVLEDQSKVESYIELSDEDGNRIDVRLQRDAQSAIVMADPAIAKRIRVTGVMTSDSYRRNSESAYELVVARHEDITLVERQPTPSSAWKLPLGILIGVVSPFLLAAICRRLLQRFIDNETEAVKGVANQLRFSYDAINDGVLVIDENRVVLAVNDEFRRLTRLDTQFGDKIGDLPASLQNRFLDAKGFSKLWTEGLNDPNLTSELEVEFDAPDISHVVIRSSPVHSADTSEPIGRILMWRDETQRRQLLTELMHANKLEAVGRLVSGVAHDFNNVLTIIAGNLFGVRADKNATVASVDDHLSSAEEAVFKGADVIRRLLTYSTKAEFEMQPASVNGIVRKLNKLVSHTFDASITFVQDLDSAEPVANVDATAIEQVLLNLYVNAKDAMPNGGTIRTSTRLDRGQAPNQDRVVIRVEDGGAGIPEELADRIFEPYFSTKGTEHGRGIGLSVSHRVIKQHGGNLQYQRRKKGGSEFRILLPRIPTRESETEADRDSDKSQTRGTVLIVDDEEVVRNLAVRMLQDNGFVTMSAGSGGEAIEILAAESLSVDVVLLDIAMVGMSGRETLTIIRNRWPALPVVLCSGYVTADFDSADPDGGPDAIIAKPYTKAELLSVLSRAARTRSTP